MQNKNGYIRRANPQDICRLAEIEIFNYRLSFYPLFQNDEYYFSELQVFSKIADYETDRELLYNTYVYDDGVVKGFARLDGTEIKKLFVEPVLQNQGIGAQLLEYAIQEHRASCLWALEKNVRAVKFYARHGFQPTGEKKLEEGTAEYLIKLKR